MSTASDVIIAALARSAKNQPDDLVTRGAELLSALNRSLRGCYAIAARVNPEYIGAIVPVVGVSGTWARPAEADSIWWIENEDGIEVAVVPPAERDADPGLPSVYRLGRSYITVGRTSPVVDPSGADVLNFYCALRPDTLTALSDSLPASWDSAYDDMLILDLAMYAALKDGRGEELTPLRAERTAWLQLYVNFLTHESANMTRRFNLPAVPTINELNQLLLTP